MKKFKFMGMGFSVPQSIGVEILHDVVILTTKDSFISIKPSFYQGLLNLSIINKSNDFDFTSNDRVGSVCFNGLKLKWNEKSFRLSFYNDMGATCLALGMQGD